MNIQLIVLRTQDPEKLAQFYQLLGYTFNYHQHGNGPYHYSSSNEGAVLEIYPLTKSQVTADKNIRIGIALDNFDTSIQVLRDQNVPFSSEPLETEYGYMVVVEDPDQRKIELYKEKV